MLIITRTQEAVLIKSIVTDPVLFELHGGKGLDPNEYVPNTEDLWLEIKTTQKTIGVCHFKNITNNTLDAHIYILPEYHKSGMAIEAGLLMIQYLQNNTFIRNVVVTVPESCRHVLNYVGKLGFRVCGMLANGVVYNNVLQNLILLQLEMRE